MARLRPSIHQPTEAWIVLRDWVNNLRGEAQVRVALALGVGESAPLMRQAVYGRANKLSEVEGLSRSDAYRKTLDELLAIAQDANWQPPLRDDVNLEQLFGSDEPEPLSTAVDGVGQKALDELELKIRKLLDAKADSSTLAMNIQRITKALIDERLQPREFVVKNTNGDVLRRVSGDVHVKFEELLILANIRLDSGFRPNIFIYGDPGSGKTTGALKAFELLGLKAEMNGALSMAYDVLGFKDASGMYQDTAFYRGYTGPCGYLFDDVDRCETSGPLTALNAALAGAVAGFPNGLQARHVDSLIVATGNTNGLGASSDFPSALRIDAAWMDRFHYRIEWNYDEAFERRLFGRGAELAQAARSAVKRAGIKGIWITPRCSAAISALLADGRSEEFAKNVTYRAILSPDQRRMLP